MHIAAARPRYIALEDVAAAELEEEKEIYRKQLEGQGKPQEIVERIIEGRVKKFYAETCLLKQPFVRDPSQTIEELLVELRSKTGENIVVKRFVRYQIGEE
jgi:elongation factor Ts